MTSKIIGFAFWLFAISVGLVIVGRGLSYMVEVFSQVPNVLR